MNAITQEEVETAFSQEDIPAVDAKKIEQEMINAAQNRAIDPAESAAMVFHMYKPEYLKRVAKLSSKQMRRLLVKLIEHPLNEKELKSFSELESQTFLLGDAMLQSKFIMMQQTYLEGAEELVKAQDNLFKNDIKEETTFGEEKGEEE
jgi:3-polyprenyl-4-hydroxybenzoate decarboxylase